MNSCCRRSPFGTRATRVVAVADREHRGAARHDRPGGEDRVDQPLALRREPTEIPMYPEFSLWCGMSAPADWHLRYNAACCVYGHLHIPRTTYYDGVRFRGGLRRVPSASGKRRGLP